ncbi:MAG: hypothetical protein Q9226_003114 [Calogaya cf. arnoldii]
MLAQTLHSSYRRYKEDTDVIATWLAVTAKRCGYSEDLLTNSHDATSSFSTSQPAGRLKGKARKLAKAEAQNPESSDSGTRPRYAIKVKEFVTLAHFIAGKRKPRVPQTVEQTMHQARGNVHNKFGKLEIQETSERFQEFINAPEIDQPVRTEIETGPQYEADLIKDQEEEYAAAQFFFQDIMYCFTCATGCWAGYNAGGDLAAASVCINTVIAFVRDLEDEFENQFPAKVDYVDKVNLFYPFQCRGRDISPEYLQDVKGYALADDVMLTTYDLVCELRDDGHDSCLCNPGIRDDSVPWPQKTPEEKVSNDRSRLREAYPLLDFISGFTQTGRMPEDELIRGVREMGPGKPIPVWLVFAFHCFLTAQNTLGDAVDQPFLHLKGLCETVRGTIIDFKEYHKSMSMTCWPEQKSQLQDFLN